jgi:hypothetical protein
LLNRLWWPSKSPRQVSKVFKVCSAWRKYHIKMLQFPLIAWNQRRFLQIIYLRACFYSNSWQGILCSNNRENWWAEVKFEGEKSWRFHWIFQLSQAICLKFGKFTNWIRCFAIKFCNFGVKVQRSTSFDIKI